MTDGRTDQRYRHWMPDDDGPKFTGRDWAMILGVPAGLALVIGLVLYFQVLAACDAARIGC